MINQGSAQPTPTMSSDQADLRHPRIQVLTDFVKELIELLKSIATSGQLPQSREFSAKLDEYTAVIAGESNIYRLEILRGKCLKAGEEFFGPWSQQISERERELREMINLLMNAVQTFSKDNTSFQSEVKASNQRMQTCCDLNDLRELKAQLTREVKQLQTVVNEKQERDAAQLTALSTRVTTLQSKLEEVEHKAQTDALTGVNNRASFDQKIHELVQLGSGFVLVMLDLDDFKKINDQHGHQVGDRALISAAVKLREAVRSSDFIARYGGEEFALMHIGARLEHSLTRVSKCLQDIAGTHYEYTVAGEPRVLSFTISAGLSDFANGDTVEDIIARADAALYEAKRQGKNRAIAVRK